MQRVKALSNIMTSSLACNVKASNREIRGHFYPANRGVSRAQPATSHGLLYEDCMQCENMPERAGEYVLQPDTQRTLLVLNVQGTHVHKSHPGFDVQAVKTVWSQAQAAQAGHASCQPLRPPAGRLALPKTCLFIVLHLYYAE